MVAHDGSPEMTPAKARFEQSLLELDQRIARIPLAEIQRPADGASRKVVTTAVFEDLANQIVVLREELTAVREQLDAEFADQSYCTRVFKRSFGETPGQYARSLKGGR